MPKVRQAVKETVNPSHNIISPP